MTPVGFELTISAGERPQTYALYGAATGTGYRPVMDTFDVCVTLFHLTFVISSVQPTFQS